MTVLQTDAFTDSDGVALTTHNAFWTNNHGAFQINTNACAPNLVADESGAHDNANTYNNDQYAQGVIVGTTSGSEIGVGARMAAGATFTYYGYYSDNLGSYLFKEVAGSWTAIGASGPAFAATDVVSIECSGTTITAKINGVAKITQTDSAIASGSAGVVGWDANTSWRIDTWEGGNLGGAVFTPRMTLLGVG